MNALARVELPVIEEAPKVENVMFHVRFQPNGDIFTIDGCPEGMKDQAWFDHLYANASDYYATRANGRGFFRIPRDVYESAVALKA